jgi:4-amino-4-deoxy-L-arabinose transferase-like glycosyltransferase
MSRVTLALLVSLIAALLVVPPIGHRIIATGGFNGDDEARSSLLARDMIDRDAWFDLHYRWSAPLPFRDKPPLFPWAIGLLSWPGGRVTETTARGPVALATIAVVLFTFLLGERLFTRRAGLWAALVLVTGFDFFANSQLILPDMLVVAFATIAGWAFWQGMTEDAGGGWLVVFYVAVAFSIFAKGPLGVIPLLTAGVWLWTEYGLRQVPRRLWSPAGIGLFLGLTLAWVVPFLGLGARTWVRSTVWADWLTWYFGVPESGDLLYTVTTGFLPWTLIAPLAIVGALRAWRAPAVRFALLWSAVPLAILLLSANQKKRYSLSMYPGAALLVGWWADTLGASRAAAHRVFAVLAVASSVAMSVALHVPEWWGGDTRRYLVGLSWELWPIVAGALVIGAAMGWGLWAGRPALLVYTVAAAMAGVLAYGIWPYNARHDELWNFRELAARVERHAPGAEAGVFQHRHDWMSIDFYLDRPPRALGSPGELRAFLGRPEHPVVVMDGRTWPAVGRELPPEVRVVDRMKIGRETLLLLRAAGPG